MKNINLNKPSNFLSKLVENCKNDRLIREDGKKVNFFNRMVDSILRRDKSTHFEAACENLSRVSDQFEQLPLNQQMEVIGRFKQVNKKVRDKNTAEKCSKIIQNLENKMIDGKDFKELTQPIFEEIESVPDHVISKVNHVIRKLDVVIEHFEENKDAIFQIDSLWMNYKEAVDEKSDKSMNTSVFNSAHTILQKKIIEVEKKFFEQNLCTDEQIDRLIKHTFSDLELEFNRKNPKVVTTQINLIKDLIEKRSNDKEFVKQKLAEIDQFLGKNVFKNSNHPLSEIEKKHLLMLGDFFFVVNEWIPFVNDKELTNNLKIKFSNLPCPAHRTAFPNLILSKKNQVEILVEKLQDKEKFVVENLTVVLKEEGLSQTDVLRLAKLVSDKGGVSTSNLNLLRTSITKRFSEDFEWDWNDYLDVKKRLEQLLSVESTKNNLTDTLKRVCKAKEFFQQQIDLNEDAIMIPRWYHATHNYGIHAILESGEILVKHEKRFKGAWVSSKVERGFGEYVLSLSDRIDSIDPNAYIGFQYDHKRWRGLQKSIPMKNENTQETLVLVGVGAKMQTDIYGQQTRTYDKTTQKVEKLKIVRTLQEKGFPDPKALSIDQVQFLQNEVASAVGTPNLSDKWWGKG